MKTLLENILILYWRMRCDGYARKHHLTCYNFSTLRQIQDPINYRGANQMAIAVSAANALYHRQPHKMKGEDENIQI